MNKSFLERSAKIIIDQLPDFVSWKGENFSYRHINENLCNLLGYKNIDQVIGITDFNLIGKVSEHAEIYREQDKKVLNERRSMKTLDIMEYPGGGIKILITNRSVLRENENILGLITQATEINNLFSKRFKLFSQYKNIPYKLRTVFNSYEVITEIKHDGKKFTNRETECIFYIIRGNTSKEIAKLLNLSPRTIENYVDNIKIKINCSKKSELIEKLLHLGYYYYIPQSFLVV